MKTLPETLTPGDTLEVQLAPFGSFRGLLRDGERELAIDQQCTPEAFKQMVEAFQAEGRELLVDFEHDSENGGSTEAAAWITELRVDPDLGLMATFKFTDSGAEAVTQRRLRYLSPCWEAGEDGVPTRLLSVGLTNKPNLPVRPILNRRPAAFNTVEEPKKEHTTMKDQIIAALGLAPEATDEEILSAVQALMERNAELEAAALNEEAEAAAEENKEIIANRDAFKKLYAANRTAAKELLATLKAPAPAQKPVCNRLAARPPAPGFAACKTPEERIAYIQANH